MVKPCNAPYLDDGSQVETLYKKSISKNLIWCDAGCFGLGIAGKYFVTVAHLQTSDIRTMRDDRFEGKVFEFTIVKELPHRDVMICKVTDKNFGDFKDIRRYIVPRTKEIQRGTPMILFQHRPDTMILRAVQTTTAIYSPVQSVRADGSTQTYECRFQAKAAVELPTVAGDCGQVYTLPYEAKNGLPCIVGIHTAGNPKSNPVLPGMVFGGCIFRDDFEFMEAKAKTTYAEQAKLPRAQTVKFTTEQLEFLVKEGIFIKSDEEPTIKGYKICIDDKWYSVPNKMKGRFNAYLIAQDKQINISKALHRMFQEPVEVKPWIDWDPSKVDILYTEDKRITPAPKPNYKKTDMYYLSLIHI